jgi:hypothetical protein
MAPGFPVKRKQKTKKKEMKSSFPAFSFDHSNTHTHTHALVCVCVRALRLLFPPPHQTNSDYNIPSCSSRSQPPLFTAKKPVIKASESCVCYYHSKKASRTETASLTGCLDLCLSPAPSQKNVNRNLKILPLLLEIETPSA